MENKTTLIERTVNLGLVDGYGNGKKNCPLDLCFRLERVTLGTQDSPRLTTDLGRTRNYVTLAMTANLWNPLKTDIIHGGQLVDDLLTYVDTPETRLWVEVWHTWHNNAMRPGTTRQQKVIDQLPDLTIMTNRVAVVAKIMTLDFSPTLISNPDRRALVGYNGAPKRGESTREWNKRQTLTLDQLFRNWSAKQSAIAADLVTPSKEIARTNSDLIHLWLMAHGEYAVKIGETAREYMPDQQGHPSFQRHPAYPTYYTYGSQWLVEEMSDEAVSELISEISAMTSQPEEPTLLDQVTMIKYEWSPSTIGLKHGWLVTLGYKNRQAEFNFSRGNPEPPTVADLIGCFQSDLTMSTDPDDLASEFGYSPSEANKIARALKTQRTKLRKLFGKDLARLTSEE